MEARRKRGRWMESESVYVKDYDGLKEVEIKD